MHGQLSTRSIADVSRELADARATGVLHIAGADAAGRLVFDQGRLVAATSPTPGSRLGDRLVNGGLLDEEALHRVLDEQHETATGERSRLGQLLVERGLVPIDAVRLVVQEQLLDAVFDLTGWREGTYRFEADADPDTPEVPLAVPVDQALVEVARRREEWATLTQVIPDLDVVPRFREGATTSTADLEPDEFVVMASVDGLRSVRDLAYDLGYGEFEAARVVYALTLLGLVEVVPPVDEIGAALDDALAYVGGDEPAGTEDEDAAGALADAVAAFGHDDPPATAGDDAEAPAPDWSSPADVEEPEPWTSWDEVVAPGGEPAGPETPAAPAPAADSAETPAPDPHEAVAGQEPWSGRASGAEHADDETLEADLPDLSGFEELRLADRYEEPTPGPTEEPADEQSPPAHAADPPGEPPAPHRASPQTSGDVSEFLRELSRLALDDEEAESETDEPTGTPDPAPGATPPPPQQQRRPAPSSREEPKRKKRGLFGFGG